MQKLTLALLTALSCCSLSGVNNNPRNPLVANLGLAAVAGHHYDLIDALLKVKLAALAAEKKAGDSTRRAREGKERLFDLVSLHKKPSAQYKRLGSRDRNGFSGSRIEGSSSKGNEKKNRTEKK